MNMAQELHVLKCFSCETFQSHIVKKTNKWECKVCGTKQSIKKVYGRGSGKDCRLHTQKLNALKGEKEGSVSFPTGQEQIESNIPIVSLPQNYFIGSNSDPSMVEISIPKISKWEQFLDEDHCNDTIGSSEGVKFQSNTMRIHQIKSGEVLKRKNTCEIDTFPDESQNKDELDDSVDNVYSAFSFLSSNRVAKKSKCSKDFCKNITAPNKYDNVENILDISQEDEILTSTSSSLKLQPKKSVQSCSSVKWAKYLEGMTNHTHQSYTKANTPKDQNLIYEHSIGLETTLTNGLNQLEQLVWHNKENDEGEERTHIDKSNVTECTNSSAERSISQKNVPKVLSETVVKVPSKHYSMNKIGSESPTKQPLIPVPIFEQNCDIIDTDFHLNF